MRDEQNHGPPVDILVIGDKPESIRQLNHILSKQGYKLQTVTDGQQALAAARLKPPDLILLDVMMPAVSGYELCEQLKADETTREIPVIFLSALTQEFDIVRGFSLGGVDYITKPFQTREVLARIETHLSLQATQKELKQRNLELQQENTERQRAEARLKRQNQALQTLHQVTLDIGSELKMPTLLNSIMVRAVDLLDADRGGGIYLHDPSKNLLRLTEGSGINEARLGAILQLNEGVVGWVFQHRQPLIVNDYTHWEGAVNILISQPPSAVMGVPLILEGQVIGVLGLFANSRQRTFSQEDIHLAEMLAAQVSIAIQNAQLNEQAQQEIAERQRVNEALTYLLDIEKFVTKQIARFINSYGDQIDSEINHFLEAVGEYVQVEGVAVGVFDQNFSKIEQIFEWPAEMLATNEKSAVGVSLKLMPWALEKFSHFETISCENVASLPPEAGFERRGLEAISIKSFVAAPLVVGGRLWGFLGCFSIQPRQWSQEALWLLKAVGQVLAEVFERKRLEQELYDLRPQINILFENSPLGVALTTLEGEILAVNQTFLELSGYPEGEFLAMNVKNLYQNQKDRKQLLQQLLTDGSVNRFGVHMKRKDGSIFDASLNVNRLTRSGQEVLLAMIEDVTTQIELQKALQRREQEVKTLIENSPDIIARFDRDLRHLYVSPAIEKVSGLSSEQFIGRSNRDLGMPESQVSLWEEMLGRVFQTKQDLLFDYSFLTSDGTRHFESHLVPELAEDGSVQSVMGINRDITTRKQAEEALQASETALRKANQNLEQRLAELTSLNLIAQTITTVTDFDSALEIVAGNVTYLFGACSTSITLLDPAPEEAKVIASFELHSSGSPLRALVGESRFGSLDLVIPVNNGALRNRLVKEGRPISLSQTQNGSAQAWLRTRNIQALLAAPLQSRGEVIGLLTVTTDQPEREFTPAEECLAETIGGQIAGAIEINRLFEDEQRQRKLAVSLRQVATALSSSLERKIISQIVFEQLQQVLPYDGASICLINGDELVISDAVGLSAGRLGHSLPLKSTSPLTQILQQRKALILTDPTGSELWPTWLRQNELKCWMGVPLIAGRSTIGLLIIEQGQTGSYRREDAEILQTFANQTAIAFENARLYEQAQTIAVDAERQRLARELHDSVTQSLYSLTLLTNGWATMARQGRLASQQVVAHFRQLEELSLQGLKEMRLLLHQLRPPILEEVGLVGALQQRLDAVEQRVNVETRLLTRGQVDQVPLNVAEQLFFIAQEALNNALRHAKATAITVKIWEEEDRLVLSVEDNGIGFDPSAPSYGLGLETIQERTAKIGGQLEIISALMQGTTVAVSIALEPDRDV